MNYLAMYLIASLAEIIFATGAVLMAINNVGGWGWMILAAVLSQASTTRRKDAS